MASEKRLIDAEALKADIERYADAEETKSIIETGGSIMSWEHRQVLQAVLALKCALKIVNEAHTIDAVEVVRCKDCKYFFDLKCYARNFMRCDPYVPEIHMTGKNDFCSHGKKRGGADNGNC